MNSIHYNVKDINKHLKPFYKKIYTQSKIDGTKMEIILDLINLPKVTNEQNKLLISKITDEEIKKANIKFKNQ